MLQRVLQCVAACVAVGCCVLRIAFSRCPISDARGMALHCTNVLQCVLRRVL